MASSSLSTLRQEASERSEEVVETVDAFEEGVPKRFLNEFGVKATLESFMEQPNSY